MNLSLGRLAGILLLAFVLAGCSKQQPSEPLRTAADDTLAEHALKHTNPKYRCPMHPDIVRDEPGVCPICGMTLVKVEPSPEAAATPAAASRKPLYYRNPMDPNQHSPVPAKDEMGMDYVPVYAEDVGGEVRISPAVMNNLGVRTEPVVRGSLPRGGDVVGYVQFDERKVQQVRPRAEGWVEGLSVRAMGETVKAGQLLFTLYSPMLESVQQEYLDALKIGNRELIDASRDRLRAVGLDAGTASRLAKSGSRSGQGSVLCADLGRDHRTRGARRRDADARDVGDDDHRARQPVGRRRGARVAVRRGSGRARKPRCVSPRSPASRFTVASSTSIRNSTWRRAPCAPASCWMRRRRTSGPTCWRP